MGSFPLEPFGTEAGAEGSAFLLAGYLDYLFSLLFYPPISWEYNNLWPCLVLVFEQVDDVQN